MSVFYLNKTSSFQILCAGSLQRCPCRSVLTVANMKCYQVHHWRCLSLKCHGKQLAWYHTECGGIETSVCGEWGRGQAPRKVCAGVQEVRLRGLAVREAKHALIWSSLKSRSTEEVGPVSSSCGGTGSHLPSSLKQNLFVLTSLWRKAHS